MKFGYILKELRKVKNFTARKLAEKLNLSVNMIYEWEHGRCEPTVETLLKLSKIFNITIEELLGVEDELGNVAPAQSNVTEKEARLLKAFATLSALEQDKLISDAEFYSMRHRKFDPIKK